MPGLRVGPVSFGRKDCLWIRRVILALSTAGMSVTALAGDLTLFDGDLTGWQEKSFKGRTGYQVVEQDGRGILCADSRASASGLYLERRIDLTRTPWLNWRWRIDEALPPLNETTRAGDDYAARVYVVVDGGLLFWKTIAMSYVWSGGRAAGDDWDNAFAGAKVRMMALRNNRDDVIGQWYSEKRNIRQDLRQQFGRDIRHIDAIAIMTDADNSAGAARACYADLFMSSGLETN